MQQLFLTGLAAQVDNLMVAVIGSKEEVVEHVARVNAKVDKLEAELAVTRKELSEEKKKNEEPQRYSCKECNFTSNHISDSYKHSFEHDPEGLKKLNPLGDNTIPTIVAEQMNVMMEEMETLKSDLKSFIWQPSRLPSEECWRDQRCYK